MRHPFAKRTDHCARRNCLHALAFLSAALFLFNCSQIRAQSAPDDWEKAAGGKRAFEVASVKQNKSGLPQYGNSNIPLSDRDNYTPTGGLFSGANLNLGSYISFAYKLTFNQSRLLTSQLPKWAIQERFDIEARGQSNATKDQVRLMMQTLLAERFKLAAHFEVRQIPVFALVVAKPPQLGPQLRPHLDDPPCPASGSTNSPDGEGGIVAGGFPIHCGAYMPMQATAPGRQRMGARNLPWQIFANTIALMGRAADRPVVDHTGLSGNIDFVLEWTPLGSNMPGFQPDLSAPTFGEALQEQLGLKLISETDPVELFVVDHIEEPSAN